MHVKPFRKSEAGSVPAIASLQRGRERGRERAGWTGSVPSLPSREIVSKQARERERE